MNREEFVARTEELSSKLWNIAEEIKELAEKARNSSLEEGDPAELDEWAKTLEEISDTLPTAFKTLDEM